MTVIKISIVRSDLFNLENYSGPIVKTQIIGRH